MRNRYYLLLFVFFLVGCKSSHPLLDSSTLGMWKYSDVRLLDPVDSLSTDRDLIALYTRNNPQTIQIRMDFLDLDTSAALDIYIAIDTNPGGEKFVQTENSGKLSVEVNWDYLIVFPATGNTKVVNGDYLVIDDRELLIVQNPVQDYIVISFPQKYIPAIFPLAKIQIIITPPDQTFIDDQTLPITFDAPSPTRAKVLFLFWNYFKSTTPSETLRSWDGAHSGPMSSRHGLKYLLEFADGTRYPVFLDSFMKTETLSAFDYLGMAQWLNELVLKERIYFINNIFGYMIYENIVRKKDYDLVVGGNDYANIFKEYTYCLQIDNNAIGSAQINYLFLQCKMALVSNGINKSPYPIIMGGDFQTSLLGGPTILNNLRSYVVSHPWIQVLSAYDLQTTSNLIDVQYFSFLGKDLDENYFIQGQSTLESSSTFHQTYKKIYSSTLKSPDNTITELARQIFLSLSYPASSDLVPLSAHYIGQIGHILAAAEWVDKPRFISSCTDDLDYDEESECILASNNIFISIEPSGAYMPFLFSIDENGPHQIIGPTWEFMLGISDPSTWDFSSDVKSDPGQILGAFVDDNNLWDHYEVEIRNNKVTFVNHRSNMQKSFTITSNEIVIEISSLSPSSKIYQIPLVLDPWVRFTKNWGEKYSHQITEQGIQWKIESGVSIQLISNDPIFISPFNETHLALSNPEDPNFDYGRGHYLPFPIALAEIHSTGNSKIYIKINP